MPPPLAILHGKRGWAPALVAGLFLYFAAASPCRGAAPDGAPEELRCARPRPAPASAPLRAAWIASVDSSVLDSPANLERELQRLSAMGFNAVFPVVWNKGALFFRSPRAAALLGPSPYLPEALRGRDVLGELVASGARHGLRVVPWFEYGLEIPAAMPLVAAHPDWFLRDAAGALSSGTGLPVAYLSPFHPAAQALLLELLLSALDNYPVDAIQLDDHFSLPVSLGYDPFTVQLYRDEHRGEAPPRDAREPGWVKWRADKLTAFVQRLSREIHARGKKLSLSPNLYRSAYETSLQDWRAWAQGGAVDEIVLQLYRRSAPSFQAELDRPGALDARACVPFSVGILAGVAGRPANSARLICAQAAAARAHGLDGFALFHAAFIPDGLRCE